MDQCRHTKMSLADQSGHSRNAQGTCLPVHHLQQCAISLAEHWITGLDLQGLVWHQSLGEKMSKGQLHPGWLRDLRGAEAKNNQLLDVRPRPAVLLF